MNAKNGTTVWPALGVIAALWAGIGGYELRQKVDANQFASKSETKSRLLASRLDHDAPSETEVFRELVSLLKQEYVEPVTDDTKLVNGSVRGMIIGLNDLNSRYLDADQLRVYKGQLAGKLEGIGVTVALQGDVVTTPTNSADDTPGTPISLPRVVISSIIPGSSAEKAGLKIGDWLHSIDGRWVMDGQTVRDYRALSAKVAKKQASQEEFIKMRKDIRAAGEHSLLPNGARERLTTGTSGEISLVVNRGTEKVTLTASKGEWALPAQTISGDTIKDARFAPGLADRLRTAISGKSEITLDLRQNTMGDFDEAKKVLAVLAPTGDYGFIHIPRTKEYKPYRVANGNGSGLKVHLIVDSTTDGPAALIASALRGKPFAKVEGASPSNVIITKFKDLGTAGYTLAIGEYTRVKKVAILATGKKLAIRTSPKADSSRQVEA